MTVAHSLTTSNGNLSSRYDNLSIERDGVDVRAQYRHLAVVVKISGDIDARNELLRATVFGRSVWNASLIRNETAHAQTAVIWRCHHPFGRQASQHDPKLGATPNRPTLMS
jgi:hypothetical protein